MPSLVEPVEKKKYATRPHLRGLKGVPAIDRFWLQVETGEGCWLWLGARLKIDGKLWYGRLSVGGKPVSAHVFSYELHYGEITNNLFVLHHCDNPQCVRPDHLFLGTQGDNNRDASAKGRYKLRKGDLMPEQKAEIVRRFIPCHKRGRGGNSHELAAEFGVTAGHIRNIVKGKR